MDVGDYKVIPDDLEDVMQASQDCLKIILEKFDAREDKGAYCATTSLILSLAAFVSTVYKPTEENIMALCNECNGAIIHAFYKNKKEKDGE